MRKYDEFIPGWKPWSEQENNHPIESGINLVCRIGGEVLCPTHTLGEHLSLEKSFATPLGLFLPSRWPKISIGNLNSIPVHLIVAPSELSATQQGPQP